MTTDIDPAWWYDAVIDGRPVRQVLAERDIATVLRFLHRRGFSRARIAALTGISETRIRQVWHGRQRISSYEVLERVALGLQIPRGLLGLGFSDAPPPRIGDLDDPAREPGFIGRLAALAVGSWPPDAATDLLMPPIADAPAPSVVTGGHVAMVREVTDRHRRFDAVHGGGSCRGSATTYLRWVSGMLTSRMATDSVGQQLLVALADLHQVVGWACHDLGDHSWARHHLTAALMLARRGDDPQQAAGCLYRLGRVSIHQNRAVEALKLWQLGQILAQDSGCLISVAVLHANEAWAYAQLGDAQRVRDSLARAGDELGRASSAAAPTWAGFFLAPADLDGISGVVYGCLARHAEHRRRFAPIALQHAAQALATRGSEEARSRVFDAIATASGHLLTRDLPAAEAHTHLAVDLAGSVASARICDRLNDLVALVPAGSLPEARHRIAALRG